MTPSNTLTLLLLITQLLSLTGVSPLKQSTVSVTPSLNQSEGSARQHHSNGEIFEPGEILEPTNIIHDDNTTTNVDSSSEKKIVVPANTGVTTNMVMNMVNNNKFPGPGKNTVKGASDNQIKWNKKEESEDEFLHRYCPIRACHSGTHKTVRGEVNQKCKRFMCFPCDCDKSRGDGSAEEGEPRNEGSFTPGPGIEDPMGEDSLVNVGGGNQNGIEEEVSEYCVMGNCCPPHDTHMERDRHTASVSGQYTGCLAQYENRSYAVVMCPIGEPHFDTPLRHACQHGEGQFTTDEPVTDMETHVVYRNKHCAECHGVRDYTPWRLQISCRHFQHLYNATSEQQLLRRLHNADVVKDDVCVMKYIPPPQTSPPACPHAFFRNKGPLDQGGAVIGICNVTGLWAEQDIDVMMMCARYTGLIFRVRDTSTPWSTFANLFCAMCNGLSLGVDICPVHEINTLNTQLPLTFLMGLQDRQEVPAGSVQACPPGQWLSFDVRGTPYLFKRGVIVYE